MIRTVMMTMLLAAAIVVVPVVGAAADNVKPAAEQWLHLKGATGPGTGKHVVFVTGSTPHRSQKQAELQNTAIYQPHRDAKPPARFVQE